MPVEDEDDVNAMIPHNLSSASLSKVTITATLIRLVRDNEITMGRSRVDISDRGGETLKRPYKIPVPRSGKDEW